LPAASAEAPAFAGFPPGGFDFLFELQSKQSREWFKANKQRYEELWVRPMEGLLAELPERLKDVFPEMPKAHRHLFRIYRDTRFAADKSPFKTHVAGHIAIRPGQEGNWSVPSVYLHFGLYESVIAVGRWELGKDGLQLYRQALDDERKSRELLKALDAAKGHGFVVHAHESLKRVPPPYPQDHPRADLLKLKGLALTLEDLPEELMASPGILEWLADRVRQTAPLALWMDRYLTV
jgi:uncharacterized protein (TIGR02453 family)